MGIVFKTQSVVTDVIGRIDGFGHRTDTQLLQHMLFGFTLHIFQHLVE